jgi:hypothetical protein
MLSSAQWGNFGFGRAVSIAYVLGIALGLGVGLALFSASLRDFGLCINIIYIYSSILACNLLSSVGNGSLSSPRLLFLVSPLPLVASRLSFHSSEMI